MLTKGERKEISKRVVSFNEDYLCYADIYECLFGERPRDSALSEGYDKAIRDRIIDLCDTSNMIELPLDKDGQVIRVGDTVFDTDGNEVVVDSLRYCVEHGCVVICTTCNGFICTYQGKELTHKKPVTIASIAGRIKEIANNDEDMSYCTSSELLDIADKLESLGDSDD